jgi:hypothetical protein
MNSQDPDYLFGWNLAKALFEAGRAAGTADFARKKSSRKAKPTPGRSYTRGAGKKQPKGKAGKSSDLKTSKSCTKGTACGRSCISANKVCGGQTLKNTVRAAAEYLKRGTTTSGKKLDDDDRRRIQELADNAQQQLNDRAKAKAKANQQKSTKPTIDNRSDAQQVVKRKLQDLTPEAGPIKTLPEFHRVFQSEILAEFDLVNGSSGTLAIGDLRKRFAGRLSDDEFDDYLRDLYDQGVVELSRDERYPSHGAIKSSFGDWTALRIDDSKIDKSIKPAAPKGPNPITTKKGFEQEIGKAIKQVQEEFNTGKQFIPIYLVRRSLGDRVTRSEFSQWLLEMQGDGVFQLEKGNVSEASKDQVRDSVETKRSGMRYYIRPL